MFKSYGILNLTHTSLEGRLVYLTLEGTDKWTGQPASFPSEGTALAYLESHAEPNIRYAIIPYYYTF